MAKGEHTELPWKITDANRNGDVYIGNKHTHHMIIVESSPLKGETQADAEFIVRACNSYEDLLAICRASAKAFRKLSNGAMAAQIEAAIAKATKE